jgi:hypothetical protein
MSKGLNAMLQIDIVNCQSYDSPTGINIILVEQLLFWE